MGIGKGIGYGYGSGKGYGYGRGIGSGRGEFSGYSCVKFVFFGFNVIFWLLGCAILGVGIWLQVSKGSYTSLAPSFNVLSATVLCIAAGILVLVIGFFGCCGAIMENKCMLITYFILVVVIFILEVVAGFLAFYYRADIESVLSHELKEGIRLKYPADNDPDETGLRTGWAMIQAELHCCGVENYTNWYDSSAWPGHNYVPLECCIFENGHAPTDCNKSGDPSKWHQKGCLTAVKNNIRHNLYVVGIVAIVIGVVQILGLLASMVLFCCLRMDKFYDEE